MKQYPPLRCLFILILCALTPTAYTLAGADLIDERASLQLGESFFVGLDSSDDMLARVELATMQNEAEPFGAGHSWWWSVGAGVAGGDRSAHIDYNGFISFEYFIVKNFEIGMEFGGWFINQRGKDASAGSFNVNLRYHFYNEGRLSIFAEVGAGFIVSTQPVPAALGTTFNFTPRAGLGLTWRFGQSRTRLLVGARWQHISNARLFGSVRNPGRDNGMLYAGVMIPF